jgi:predicted MFS family arabinose efflux permease
MNPWRGLGNLPRDIWVLSITTLINRMGTMALPFLVLYLTRGLGFSAERAAIVITVYGIGALITGPIAGRLCDWAGALIVMRTTLLLSGLVLTVFPLAGSFTAILLATIIWSVISEAFRPASLAILTDLVKPEQRKAAFALNRLAINLGMSIGPAAGGFLAVFSFPALFIVDGVTSILAGILLIVLPLRGATQVKKREAGSSIGNGNILADRRLVYFIAAVIPVLIVFFQHTASMPLFMVRDLGMSVSVYGMLFTVNTLLITLLEVPLNLKMAEWSHRHSLVLGTVLCGIGFGAMIFATGVWSMAATVVVWTFGEMILFPSTAAYMADIAPDEKRGQYMGLYTMSFSIAFIGSSIGPAVLERFGALVLWGGSFALCTLSAIMMARLYPHPSPSLIEEKAA